MTKKVPAITGTFFIKSLEMMSVKRWLVKLPEILRGGIFRDTLELPIEIGDIIKTTLVTNLGDGQPTFKQQFASVIDS